MKRLVIALLVMLLATLPQLTFPAAAAPEAQQGACLFFTETGGGQGGFSVCDDSSARFRTAFNQWGLQRIGYPISQRYMRDGFVTQAFQKAIMQWRPDGNYVALVNVFDDLHNAGFDQRLLETRQTPHQFPAGYDGDATFAQVVERRQALLNERPALRSAYFSVSDPLLFFGLPTSEVEDMGNHYAIRLQRAVLQEWKETVPWASAGQVTIANGADIAKELGALPAEALVPVAGDTPPAQPPAQPTQPPAQPTQPPAPQPTASGKVLFTSNRTSFDDCYSMNADGSDVRQLTTFGQCYDAHYTPNGQAIVFSHGADIWKMNADGSGQVNLTNTPDNPEAFPVVSPDGQRVAYLFAWPGGFEIYTMKLDGTDRKPLTSRSVDLAPAYAPNGQQVAFASLRDGTTFNIWVVNSDGSGLRQVTTFGGDRIALYPVFSPDGNQIAFSTISDGGSWEIWTVNLDGSNAHRVVGTVGNDPANSVILAAWKDGQFLFGGFAGNWDPYFVPVAGGEPVRIPSSDKDDTPSDWRP